MGGCVRHMYLDLIQSDPVNNALMKYASGKAIFTFDEETEALEVQVWPLHHRTTSLPNKGTIHTPKDCSPHRQISA